MSNTNENPISKEARAERRSDIDAAHNAGQISDDQHSELHGIENNTTSWVKARYAGLAAMCLVIGTFLVLGS